MLVYVALEGQLSHLENVVELPALGEIVTVGESDWVITRVFMPLTTDDNDLPVLNLHPVVIHGSGKSNRSQK